MKNRKFLAKRNNSLPKQCVGIVFSLVLFSFCFFAWLTLNPTAAWFSSNRTVEGNGMKVNLSSNADTAKVTYYMATAHTDDEVTFSSTAATDADTPLILPQYKMLGSYTQGDCPYVLIHIEMETAQSNFHLYANANATTTGFVGSITDLTAKNNFSSIVAFYVWTNTDKKGDEPMVTGSKESGYTFTLDKGSKKNFFETDGTNNLKIKHNVELLNSPANVTDIYLVVSYDEELISHVYAANLGKAFGVDGIKFGTMDFSFELTTTAKQNT